MEAAQQELVRSKLQNIFDGNNERRKEIDIEMKALSSEMPVEPIDRTQLDSELQMLRSESNRLVGKNKEVRLAVAAISEGEYGWCESCGHEIDQERLLLRPESITCVHCQALSEKHAKLYSDNS